jgi:hypothetical protein
MRPTATQLNRMFNLDLMRLAEENASDKELLVAIRRALAPRTNRNADFARRKVDLLLGIAPTVSLPVPPPLPRKHRPYLLKLAVAVAGLLIVGVGHGAGQSIWEAVWPSVEAAIIGAP